MVSTFIHRLCCSATFAIGEAKEAEERQSIHVGVADDGKSCKAGIVAHHVCAGRDAPVLVQHCLPNLYALFKANAFLPFQVGGVVKQ
jgi:hypothetical protein